MAPDKRTFVGVFYIILLLSMHPLNARRASQANSLVETSSNLDSVVEDLKRAQEEDLQEEAVSKRIQNQIQQQSAAASRSQHHAGVNHTRLAVLDGDLAGPFHEENLCDQTLFLRYKDGQDQTKESTFQVHSWDNVELFKKSDADGCVQTYTAICARGGMKVTHSCASKGAMETEFRRFRRATNHWRKSSISQSQTAQLRRRATNGTAVGDSVQLTPGGRLDVWVKDGADTDQKCSSKKKNFEAKMAEVNDKLAMSKGSGAKIPFTDAARLVLKTRKAVKELKSAQKNGCPWLQDQSVDTGAMEDLVRRSASENPCFEKAKGVMMASQDGNADAQQAALGKAMKMLMSDKCEVKESDVELEAEDMSLDLLEQDLDEKAEGLHDKSEGMGLASALLQTAAASGAGEMTLLTAILLLIIGLILFFILLCLMCFVAISLTFIILGIIMCLLKGLIVLLVAALTLGHVALKYDAPKCLGWWMGKLSDNAIPASTQCAGAVLHALATSGHHKHRR